MPTVGDRAADAAGDADLVERILADPTTGWADAWERYGHQLHSYCQRMLDNSNDADDAVADVFLVAAQRIGSLREPEAFRAWLYAIARRHVQQGWRDRQRTTPVDPHGDTVVSAAATQADPIGATDAAELIAAASTALSERDRELLALALGSDLDTGEIARITGESPGFVSVRVTRLKDRVGRAAGALLVARHHRRDCDELAELLSRWDGTFDMKWRNRIARHVEGCEDCSRRRKAATAVFAAPLLLAPPNDALRRQVLSPISSSSAVGPDLGPWEDSGFPAVPRSRKLPIALAVAAAVLIAVVAVIGLLGPSESESPGLLAAVDMAPTTRPTPTTQPISTAPPTTLASTTTTSGPEPTGSSTTVATPLPAEPEVATDPSPETSAPTDAPTVSVTLSPTSIWTGTETSQATVTVAAPAGAATSEVSWDGPEPGSVALDGEGTHQVIIGPFTAAPPSPDVSGTVTVTATTTDSLGRTRSSTAALAVTAAPI